MKKAYENTSQGTVSKISSGIGKIKGALKTNQPVEGAVFPQEIPVLESEPTPFIEDLIPPDVSQNFRDLNAWKISIPDIETRVVSYQHYITFNNFNL